MKKFYYLKLFQALLTVVVIWEILSTEKLCGKFAGPQCFVDSATTNGHCNKFIIFRPDAMKPTKLDVANMTELVQLSDHLPSGEQCLPINISIVSSFRNAFNCVSTNQLENTADVLARVLYLSLVFLFVLVCHSLIQQPLAEYDFCGYLCAAYGVFIWAFSAVEMILLAVNWTSLWECTNFRPEQSFILYSLIFSVVLLCSSLYEFFSNCALQQENVADAQTQTINDVPKISAIKGLKNDDFFTVRAMKC